MTPEKDNIYIEAEANANMFNLNVLSITTLMASLSELLNEIGIFKVQRGIMLPAVLLAMACFMIPPGMWWLHDRLRKKTPSLLEDQNLRIWIIVSAYLGIAVICVMLSFHAVILLALPPLMAAQYRYRRKMAVCVLLATVLLVPVSVYGSFFLGLPDRNFIKHMLTEKQSYVLANRLRLATPTRMAEIGLHYVLPRLLGVVLTTMLAIGIEKRNSWMLERQDALARQAREEMERRSGMQAHVIEDLAAVIETRDVSSGEHVVRTRRYVGMIAHALRRQGIYAEELSEDTIADIESAAPLHDVGKIVIPDAILLKPGRLTEEEFSVMKGHAEKGGEMVETVFSDLADPLFLKKAYRIALYHHERWDGTGYPMGLKGEAIPLEARIMAVADVYDALVSHRVYKEALPPEDAFAILVRGAGTHFDPRIIEAVKSIRAELLAEARKRADK